MMKCVQTYAQLTYCDDAYFEAHHGWTHVWVGGYMLPLFQVCAHW
jgi:hypothetical protein